MQLQTLRSIIFAEFSTKPNTLRERVRMYDSDVGTKEAEKVHVSSTRIGPCQGCSITIEGLTKEELEKMEGCVRGGMWWAKGGNDKIEFVSNYQPLPDPAEDAEMLPFWRRPTAGEKSESHTLFEMEKLGEYDSPSIMIQSLCGYYYTADSYKKHGEELRSYGFECLRSRRGPDARYWEIWYLPGLWCAAGKLREHIDQVADKKKHLHEAMNFLARYVAFGTLAVSVQRMAMVID